MKEKTIHELVKGHPDKSYRDMERYRDADRIEEAQRVPMTESRQKQEELEPIEGVNWEELYKKEHKLRQKAEKELADLKKKVDPAHKIQKARESGL